MMYDALVTHRIDVEQTSQTYIFQAYEISCQDCPGFSVRLRARTTSYDETRALMAQVDEVVKGHKAGVDLSPKT